MTYFGTYPTDMKMTSKMTQSVSTPPAGYHIGYLLDSQARLCQSRAGVAVAAAPCRAAGENVQAGWMEDFFRGQFVSIILW